MLWIASVIALVGLLAPSALGNHVRWDHDTRHDLLCVTRDSSDEHVKTVQTLRQGGMHWVAELHLPVAAVDPIGAILTALSTHQCEVSHYSRGNLLVGCAHSGDDASNVVLQLPQSLPGVIRRVCLVSPESKIEPLMTEFAEQRRQTIGISDADFFTSSTCVKALLFPAVTSTNAREALEQHVTVEIPIATFTWPSQSLVAPAPRDESVLVCAVAELHTALAAVIAQAPHVYYVEAQRVAKASNLWSRGWLMTGEAENEPLLQRGIRGVGSVVGIADTGIDHDHCFFNDPQHPIRRNEPNAAHRKIIRYTSYDPRGSQAYSDFVQGHGTHVAGTVAGVSLNMDTPTAKFSGMAPGARISFTDIAPEGESISLPGNLESVFREAVNDGAYIHTNSWGMTKGDYPSASQEVDRAMASTQHLLVIFAAGNYGDSVCPEQPTSLRCDRFTVVSPSTAKNALSVGSSMALPTSWIAAGYGNYRATFLRDTAPPTEWVVGGFTIVRAEFGSEPVWNGVKLHVADPLDACSTLRGLVPAGRILVVKRGTCKFGFKANAAHIARAGGLLVINHITGDPIIMGNDKDNPTVVPFPCVMVSQDDGARLLEMLQNFGEATLTSSLDPRPNPHKDANDLSAFSSRGPTNDFRYKPDLVAVGEFIHSARSDGNVNTHNCDTFPSQGTSMAAPSVAGMAVLVREFFQRGFNPTGRETSSDSVTLFGDALKAVLIHASTPLTGLFDRNTQGDWQRLGPTPSFDQGHGLLRLNTSLPVLETSPARLFVHQNQSLTTSRRVTYCVRYTALQTGGSVPFRAVLAWTDPPAHPGAQVTLINDLDLRVITPSGVLYLGNAHGPVSDENAMADNLNNVEKVTIPNAENGVYRVVVSATTTVGSQRFSIAVSGEATTDAECITQCSTTCRSESGTCKMDSGGAECVCKLGWAGSRCDIPVASLSPEALDIRDAVDPMQTIMFRFTTVAQIGGRYTLTFQSTSVDGDPNLYVSRNAVPHVFGHLAGNNVVAQATNCDNCNTKLGGTIPGPTTIGVDSDGSEYVVVVAGFCCARAPFSLQIATTNPNTIATPHVSRVSTLGGHSLGPVLWYPSSVPTTLVINGAFDQIDVKDAQVHIGQWHAKGVAAAPCDVVSVNESTVVCIVSAATAAKVCPQGEVHVLVQQGSRWTRVLPQVANISCRELPVTATTPSGKPVLPFAMKFLQVAPSRTSTCQAQLRNRSVTLNDVMSCFLHTDAVLSPSYVATAAVASSITVPHAVTKRDEPVFVVSNDAIALTTSSANPMRLRVYVVQLKASNWIDCGFASMTSTGFAFVLPAAAALDGRDAWKLVISTRTQDDQPVSFYMDQTASLSVLRPAESYLTLDPKLPHSEEGLPTLPYNAMLAPVVVYIVPLLATDTIAPVVDASHATSVSLALAFAEVSARATSPFTGTASSTVSGAVKQVASDGRWMALEFAPSSLQCGVPFRLGLDDVTAWLLEGTSPLDFVTDDTLLFACPSVVHSVASHTFFSHRLFVTDLSLPLRFAGEFPTAPTGPILLKDALNANSAITCALQQTGRNSLTCALPEDDRRRVVPNRVYNLEIPMNNEGPGVVLNTSVDPTDPTKKRPLTFVSAQITNRPRFGQTTVAQLVAPSGLQSTVLTFTGTDLLPSPAIASSALVLVLKCVSPFGSADLPCAIEQATSTSIQCVMHPQQCGECIPELEVRVPDQVTPVWSVTSLNLQAVFTRPCVNVSSTLGELRIHSEAEKPTVPPVFIVGRHRRVQVVGGNQASKASVRAALDTGSFDVVDSSQLACASVGSDMSLTTTVASTVALGAAAGGVASVVEVSSSVLMGAMVSRSRLSGIVDDDGAAVVNVPVALVACFDMSPTIPLALASPLLHAATVQSFAWNDYIIQPERLYKATSKTVPLISAKLTFTDPLMRFAVTNPSHLAASSSFLWKVWIVPVPLATTSALISDDLDAEDMERLCRTTSTTRLSLPAAVADANRLLTVVASQFRAVLSTTETVVVCLAAAATGVATPADMESLAAVAVPIVAVKTEACATNADCGGQGHCNVATKQCLCSPQLRGRQCEITCPVRASDGAICDGRGTCDALGACVCTAGYSGRTCSGTRVDLVVEGQVTRDSSDFLVRIPRVSDAERDPFAVTPGSTIGPTWQLIHVYSRAALIEFTTAVTAVNTAGRTITKSDGPLQVEIFQWCDSKGVGDATAAFRRAASTVHLGAGEKHTFRLAACASMASPCASLTDAAIPARAKNATSVHCLGVFVASSTWKVAPDMAHVLLHVDATVVATPTPAPSLTPAEACDRTCRTVHAAVFAACLSIGLLLGIAFHRCHSRRGHPAFSPL